MVASFGGIIRNMSGRASRRKGYQWERDVSLMFREFFPEAKRGIGQARSGGEVPDVAGAAPFWIECKRGKKTNIKAALRQAEEAMTGIYKYPVAVCKDDREIATITMRLDHFFEIFGDAADVRA